MHPALMYEYARGRMTDEQNAADRRRLKKLAAESRPPRTADQSIVGRVWNLLTGFTPSKPVLTGTPS